MRSYATACHAYLRPRDLLDLASVAGPSSSSRPCGEPPRTPAAFSALEGLEPAERSGLIEEILSRSIAYRFTHELVRRALYDRLSGPRRAELHLRVAEALEGAHRSPAGPVLADLAHHFTVAAALGGRERAITYNLLAAEAATAALDHDEAAARLRTALELGIDGERRQAEGAARARRRPGRAGESLKSIHAYREAGEIARTIRDGELLARLLLGSRKRWRPGMLDQRAVEFLEEASAALPAGDSVLRARVLAGLALGPGRSGRPSPGRRRPEERDRDGAPDRRPPGPAAAHARLLARGATPLEDVLEMLTNRVISPPR